MTPPDPLLATETAKRRTFAIISHPDAGKTTLTEKLLLYAGMIRTAGMVHGRKTQKATSSDWMQMEQERGISITASAMQFHYKDVVINVLDTPGHQDFSEDTYRTLTAADSAVMVLDAAKGVETQTRKLFSVCRMRGIPILTFINKMDLPGREPLDLLSELEEVLGIDSSPLNWPIGGGENFKGVVDRRSGEAIIFEKGQGGGSNKAVVKRLPLEKLVEEGVLNSEQMGELEGELELINEAGNPFTKEGFLAGELTPVFFGSALTNFGVEPFFDTFAELAPSPRSRTVSEESGEESRVDPVTSPFSAFVFKIQANMDPRHRDSMAYLRICSGRFERDLSVHHDRLKKQIRLSRAHNMFGGERSTLQEAFPGDIVGVVNPGVFAMGDSVSVGKSVSFPPPPKFPPEVVARIRPKDVMRRKAYEKGMKQFRDEGAVLILEEYKNPVAEPLVAAVGPLQFEVLRFRLQSEYNVETVMDILSYKHGSWLVGDPDSFELPSSSLLARAADGQIIMLYAREWEKNHALELNPEHRLVDFIQ
ncbi:MAG: peptide chain release factor 3 [Bdellovibrionales bacterium]|nr:peptide chain release factor 3 [Bdellovibrionales bacterium]